MTPGAKLAILGGQFNPYRQPYIAARYSLDGNPGDGTFLINGSNQIQLIADRSGNSSTNALVLPATTAGMASTPNAAPIQITGDIDIRCKLSQNTWVPGAATRIIVKRDQTTCAYDLSIRSTGELNARFSLDGGISDPAQLAISSVVTGLTALSTKWIRSTRQASSGTVKFYLSDDGDTWTQLGTSIATTAGNIFNASNALTIGADTTGGFGCAGVIFYADVRNGYDGAGSVVAKFDPTGAAKLASSFASSTGETWTVTTSGDTGARLCGARDLVQMTAANRPIFSTGADGRNLATFDGSNDYLKAAPFSLAQPETVYGVISSVTWTDTDQMWAGNAATTMGLLQAGTTPAVVINAGSSVASNTNLVLVNPAVAAAVYNGASSNLMINRTAATTGNAGAADGGGFTVGANSGGTAASNITLREAIIRSVADPLSVQFQYANYLIRKWGIAA